MICYRASGHILGGKASEVQSSPLFPSSGEVKNASNLYTSHALHGVGYQNMLCVEL
jgi:hypothetical protein